MATFAITREALACVANVIERYGPYFAERVWIRAEQIARETGRSHIEIDDMKAALDELL